MAIDVFLTEKDDALLSSSTRDPLGFEVLWTNFGNEAIPYVTTQSEGAINYIVVTVLQHWIDEYVVEKGDGLPAYLEGDEGQVELPNALVMVAEQLVIYSVLEEGNETSRLYGVNKARGRWRAEETVHVGPFGDDPVLKRQRANGMFGRYEGPLVEMGIFDKTWEGGWRRRLRRRWADLCSEYFVGEEPYESARAAMCQIFDELLGSGGGRVPFGNVFLDKERAVEGMCQLRSPAALARVVDELLGEMGLGGDAETSQRLVWEALDDPGSERAVFEGAREQSETAESQGPLRDVLELESALAPIETIFKRLWHVGGSVADDEVVEKVWAHLEADGPRLNRRLRRLRRSEAIRGSGEGQCRLDQLANMISESGTAVDFIRDLVGYHRQIMEGRNANPWVELEDRNSQPLNDSYSPGDQTDIRIGDGMWGERSYYVDFLNQFREDIVDTREGEA